MNWIGGNGLTSIICFGELCDTKDIQFYNVILRVGTACGVGDFPL